MNNNSQVQMNRIDGGRLDRNRVINFRFNGKKYAGYAGDTVASALLANGVKVIGRSFKYARPRGIMAAGVEEPNAILQLGASAETQTPNIRATEQEIYEGLVCSSTNGWPNVDFDVMAWFGALAGRFMPPGFYYKTFMFPKFMWRRYEEVIRKGAGLGKVSEHRDPDRYDSMNQHADVLIVGAGPAGIAAALAASQPSSSQTSARVMLIDEQAEMGGQLLHSTETINHQPPVQWLADSLQELQQRDNVILLKRTTVTGYHDHNFLTAVERCTDHCQDRAATNQTRQRLHRIRAQRVILATGAQERPLVYGNNDRPGCMQASAISTYIHRYAVLPGRKLVLMTTNDSAYQTALDWHNAAQNNNMSDAKVVAIVDSRPASNEPSELIQQAQKRGIVIINQSAIIETKTQLLSGGKQIESVSVARLQSGAVLNDDMGVQKIACDTVASSGGWSPVVHLSCHTGNKPQWREDIQAFVPALKSIQKRACAGSVTGSMQLAEVLKQGFDQGADAAEQLGFEVQTSPMPEVVSSTQAAPMALYCVPHKKPMSRAPKQFVDYQLDVTAAAIELATREGFESIEHVKRYTALGFGTDQGKTSNVNGLAVAAQIMNKSIPEVGTTIFRPNYSPVSFGALAAMHREALFDIKRYTAAQPWHEKNGAIYEDVGQWKRPRYFTTCAESMDDAVNRECLAVRNAVGILDASTLGKIDIQGPDAREFLNRVYSNAWTKLAVGKCRYGLMLGEDGMVKDDGVTVCLADNHFMMHTTTGGAATVLEWLELWHQTEWPELQVFFNTVTDHWSTTTISGPNARQLLAQLTDQNLDGEHFKFMDWKAAEVAGVPARIYRISFTGELSFEINVSANYGLHIWEQLIEKGQQFGITPYGTEAMHVLRAEKGFIIVGQDTDGAIPANNLGMDWIINRNKAFSFIGKRGMDRAGCSGPNIKQFVGLKTKDPLRVLPEGAQLVLDAQQAIPMSMVGHVTSSYYSACLGHSIALAVVKDGLQKMGETVYAPLVDGSIVEAEICNPVFYDAEAKRQHV